VWVPKAKGDKRPPNQIPEGERDYYLERIYPSFGNLVPRDVASRQAKFRVDEGRGVGSTGVAVYLDFADAIKRLGEDKVSEKYGNLFQMYEKIAGENPYKTPMRIFPAVHYTMGGLWVDYNLMSTIPGLFVGGEANFSDHGANRLGASALMQGLADGYFVLPYTIGNYIGSEAANLKPISDKDQLFAAPKKRAEEQLNKLMAINGKRTVDDFHRELGKIMWEKVGMERSRAGLEEALRDIPKLRDDFWKEVKVTGPKDYTNQELEKAGRVADFMELGELMAKDALTREESCGGHFRVEHQTPDNEALRDDEKFCHVAAWEYKGPGQEVRHQEELRFENVKLAQRSYK
jgi:succinate dehydrogenase / fumarate reductase flavoprotein subunit